MDEKQMRTKSLSWNEHLRLDKEIIVHKDHNYLGVECVNCGLQIGHPSILRETRYECPRCGYKYR